MITFRRESHQAHYVQISDHYFMCKENQRTFFDFSKYPNLNGYADGLTADWNGNLWLACWKGGCVIKIDGVTGTYL